MRSKFYKLHAIFRSVVNSPGTFLSAFSSFDIIFEMYLFPDMFKEYCHFQDSFSKRLLRLPRTRSSPEYSRLASLVISGLILPKRGWCRKKGTLLSHRAGKDGETALDTPRRARMGARRGQKYAWPLGRQIKMIHRRFHMLLAKTSSLLSSLETISGYAKLKYPFRRRCSSSSWKGYRAMFANAKDHGFCESCDSWGLLAIRQLRGIHCRRSESPN